MPKVISRRTHVGTGVGEVAGAMTQGQRGALTADQQENVRRPRAECDAHTHLLGSLRHDPLSAPAGLSPTGGISRQSL